MLDDLEAMSVGHRARKGQGSWGSWGEEGKGSGKAFRKRNANLCG